MSWAIYAKRKDGEEVNIFTDKRTWVHRHSARNNMEQLQEVYDVELYLKKIEDAATDTERFNVMVEHGLRISKIPDKFPGMTKWMYQVHALLPAFDTPREAIDDYIRRENEHNRSKT